MGAHMARNLLKKDHEVVVFDISSDAVSELESDGARSAATPAAVASECGVVVTM